MAKDDPPHHLGVLVVLGDVLACLACASPPTWTAPGPEALHLLLSDDAHRHQCEERQAAQACIEMPAPNAAVQRGLGSSCGCCGEHGRSSVATGAMECDRISMRGHRPITRVSRRLDEQPAERGHLELETDPHVDGTALPLQRRQPPRTGTERCQTHATKG